VELYHSPEGKLNRLFFHSALASIDFADPEVQNDLVRLRVLVPNLDGSLRPGLLARVRVILGPPREAVLIPENVVEVQVDRRYVGVLNDKNIVERRLIRVAGQRYDDLLAVETGLRAGEWVILDRPAAARIGEKVLANNIDRTEKSPQSAEKPPTR
jgi:multidrug efflux pump subunit AcrA (membrane-fusion protein)